MSYGSADMPRDAVLGGATLYRSDGMLIAMRVDNAVNVGADPRLPIRQRSFLTVEQAAGYMVRVADADASGLLSLIIPPGQQFEPWESMRREEFTHYALIEDLKNERKVLIPGEGDIRAVSRMKN